MEAPETAAHMAETSDMGDTHAVGETATSKMGDIYAAISETVTSKMGGTYAAAETPAAIANTLADALAPLGAETFELPMTPERLFRVIKTAKARGQGEMR